MNRTSKLVAGLGLIGGGALLTGIAARVSNRRRPVTGPIVVVGDSLAVGIGEALEGLHDAVDVQAHVGEGVSATLNQMADRLEGVPDRATVVISTGANSLVTRDAVDLAADVSAMIRDLRDVGFRVILIGLPPARLWGDRRRGVEWNEELWRLNTIYSRMIDFVDTWDVIGDPINAGYYDPEFGAPDGLHPNRAGYEELALTILEGEQR